MPSPRTRTARFPHATARTAQAAARIPRRRPRVLRVGFVVAGLTASRLTASRRAASRLAAAALLALCALLLPAHGLAAPAIAAPATSPTGELYVAGYNALGQLGDGTNVERLSIEPAPYFGFPVTSVSGTFGDTFAVLANGAVSGSGSEEHGGLGDGQSAGARFIPAFVGGLASVTAVAAGTDHFGIALTSNGTALAWGFNEFGELGIGNVIEQDAPVPVPGIQEAAAIGAGCFDSYVLRADGKVESFGENDVGELGNGQSKSEQPLSTTPVEVKGLEGVVALAPGCKTVYALRSDGTVWSWGAGEHGQLGNGAAPLAPQTTAVQVKGLEHVIAIAAGGEAGYALLANGTIAAWGYNTFEELGDGTDEERKEPVIVPGLAGVRAIGASQHDGYAVLGDGSLYGWGENEHGQLGDGTREKQKPPERLPAPAGVIALGTGSDDFGLLAIEGATAALSATAIAFPSTALGTPSPAQTVTLTNQGPAPLAISGDVLSAPGAGASAPFARTADTCAGATLAVGSACAVTLAFTPSAAGAASGTLAFSSSASNAPPPVALSGTGVPPPPPPAPRLSALRVSPRTAVLAGRRVRCTARRRRKRGRVACHRPLSLRVTFALSAPARVRFRVARLLPGVRASGRCLANGPRRSPRRAGTPGARAHRGPGTGRGAVASRRRRRSRRTCTRVVALRGGFARSGRAGRNRFAFRPRSAQRALGPGSYRLLATPYAGAVAGATARAGFRLVR